ncbi:MAG: hypothetical protein JNK26_00230 [Candidatus Doudnabacteria bacterium]|nr:hypothetical protein [Candidatus Doudnabacteria bacterium]
MKDVIALVPEDVSQSIELLFKRMRADSQFKNWTDHEIELFWTNQLECVHSQFESWGIISASDLVVRLLWLLKHNRRLFESTLSYHMTGGHGPLMITHPAGYPIALASFLKSISGVES